MGKYFWREDVVPMVEAWIGPLYEATGEFVPHHYIVFTVLMDHDHPDYKYVEQVSYNMNKTPEWVADNMVKWFSQWITVGKSDSEDRFERIWNGQNWAYRPRERDVTNGSDG